jgi:hypothetical protein
MEIAEIAELPADQRSLEIAKVMLDVLEEREAMENEVDRLRKNPNRVTTQEMIALIKRKIALDEREQQLEEHMEEWLRW